LKAKRSVVEFENLLDYATGGIALYRKGSDEFFLTHGFPLLYEKLEAIKKDLQALGMYERCRDALRRAEALYRQGKEYDEEGSGIIVEAQRALMQASGSYKALERRYMSANDGDG
jgi:hypothetical protein